MIRDALEDLLGLWKDEQGSAYELTEHHSGQSLTVTTIRPDGTIRCTPGLIRVELYRGIEEKVAWGKGFFLQDLLSPARDEICWTARDGRKRSFKWMRVPPSYDVDQSKHQKQVHAPAAVPKSRSAQALLDHAVPKSRSAPPKVIESKSRQAAQERIAPDASRSTSLGTKSASSQEKTPEASLPTPSAHLEATSSQDGSVKARSPATGAISVGSRVEAKFRGEWYIGTVRHLPAADKEQKGRYAVQCDVDKPGILTKTATVRMVTEAGASAGKAALATPSDGKSTPGAAEAQKPPHAKVEASDTAEKKDAVEQARPQETAAAEIKPAEVEYQKATNVKADAPAVDSASSLADDMPAVREKEKATAIATSAEQRTAEQKKAEAAAIAEAAAVAAEAARAAKAERAEAAALAEAAAVAARAEAAAIAEAAAVAAEAATAAKAARAKAAESRAAREREEAEARKKAKAEACRKADEAKIAADHAAREKASAEKVARMRADVAKAAEARAAAEKASQRKAEVKEDSVQQETAKALREKEMAEKDVLEKVAAEKSARESARAASSKARKAGHDLKAVEDFVVERGSASKLAYQTAAAEMAAAAKLATEQEELQKIVSQKKNDIKDVLDTINELRSTVAKLMEEKVSVEVHVAAKSDEKKAAFAKGKAQELLARQAEEDKTRASDTCEDLKREERSLKKKAETEHEEMLKASEKRRAVENVARDKARHYRSLNDEMAKVSKMAAERKRLAISESDSLDRALHEQRVADKAAAEKATQYYKMVDDWDKAAKLVDELTYEPLCLGEMVLRKGREAVVVKIDRTLEPPSFTVRMLDSGNEVGTERQFLEKVPKENKAIDVEVEAEEEVTIVEKTAKPMDIDDSHITAESGRRGNLISDVLAQADSLQSASTPDLKSKPCMTRTPSKIEIASKKPSKILSGAKMPKKIVAAARKRSASSCLLAQGSVAQFVGPFYKRCRTAGGGVWPLTIEMSAEQVTRPGTNTVPTLSAEPASSSASTRNPPQQTGLQRCLDMLEALPDGQRKLPACASYCFDWLSCGQCQRPSCSYWHSPRLSAAAAADDPFKLGFAIHDAFKRTNNKALARLSSEVPDRRCFVLDGAHCATVKALGRKSDEILAPNADADTVIALQGKCLTACSTASAALEIAAKCGITFGCVYLDYMWPLDYFEKRSAALKNVPQESERGQAIQQFLAADLCKIDGFQDVARLLGSNGGASSSLLSPQGTVLAVTLVSDHQSSRPQQQARLERLISSGCCRIGFECRPMGMYRAKGRNVTTIFYALRQLACQPMQKLTGQKRSHRARGGLKRKRRKKLTRGEKHVTPAPKPLD